MNAQDVSGTREDHRPLFNGGRKLTTRSGLIVLVRSANDDDEDVLAEFFTHVTPDDLRFRFLSALQKVDHAQLSLLLHSDHHRVENFLAFDADTGQLLASATLAIAEDLEHAEVAIVIRSDHKNMGIGWSLLDFTARTASDVGVKKLQAIEVRENQTAMRVERDMGFTALPYPGDATLTLLEKSLVTMPAETALSGLA